MECVCCIDTKFYCTALITDDAILISIRSLSAYISCLYVINLYELFSTVNLRPNAEVCHRLLIVSRAIFMERQSAVEYNVAITFGGRNVNFARGKCISGTKECLNMV